MSDQETQAVDFETITVAPKAFDAAGQISNNAPHTWYVTVANTMAALPQCTPSRRELLTGGLRQAWDGLRQAAGALRP